MVIAAAQGGIVALSRPGFVKEHPGVSPALGVAWSLVAWAGILRNLATRGKGHGK